MSSSAVTATICSAANLWQFSAASVPTTTIPSGLYNIRHASLPFPNVFLNLSSDGKSLVFVRGTATLFFVSTNQGGNTIFTGFNSQPGSLQYLDSVPCDQSTPPTPVSTSTPVGVSSSLMLGKDNSMWNSKCNVRYKPSADFQTIVVATSPNDPDAYKWIFEAYTPPSLPVTVPAGTYYFSYTDMTDSKTYYLDVGADGVVVRNPVLNLGTQAFVYDGVSKLTTVCQTKVLVYNPDTSWNMTMVDTSTSPTPATVLLVNPTAQANYTPWMIGSTGARPSMLGTDVFMMLFDIPYYTSDKNPQWKIIPAGPIPYTSISSGNYTIKDNAGQCLNADGTTGSCGTTLTSWTYASDAKTLTLGSGKCLLNPNDGTLCGTKKPLTVGDCKDPGAARFVLTTDNRFLDPVSGLCYSDIASAKLQLGFTLKEIPWWGWLIFAFLILLVVTAVLRRH